MLVLVSRGQGRRIPKQGGQAAAPQAKRRNAIQGSPLLSRLCLCTLPHPLVAHTSSLAGLRAADRM